MPTLTFHHLETEKKESITTIAVKEFSIHSFKEASVNTIVKKAGISKGSLYQYFNDKVDLYLYVLQIAASKKFEFLKSCEKSYETNDFFDWLTMLMTKGCEFDLNNPLYCQLIHHALTGPLVDTSMEHLRTMNSNYLKQILVQKIEKHQVRVDVELDMMVFFLNSLTTQFASYVAQKSGFQHLEDVYHPDQLETIKTSDTQHMIKELMKLIKHGMA